MRRIVAGSSCGAVGVAVGVGVGVVCWKRRGLLLLDDDADHGGRFHCYWHSRCATATATATARRERQRRRAFSSFHKNTNTNTVIIMLRCWFC